MDDIEGCWTKHENIQYFLKNWLIKEIDFKLNKFNIFKIVIRYYYERNFKNFF